MKAVLTIAGSDSNGGAGIQADLKTIAAHHLFGESVITALTAQNTLGVTGVLEVDPVFVGTQIDAVFDDIRPDAVKIGMVSSPVIVGAIADGLDRHKAANVVVDPVMVATSGSALIADAAVDALVRQLFPRASVITPNIPEAEVLSGDGYRIVGRCGGGRLADRRPLRRRLGERAGFRGRGAFRPRHPHQGRPWRGRAGCRRRLPAHGQRRIVWLRGKRITNDNTHGTGCSLSSAIALRPGPGLCRGRGRARRQGLCGRCLGGRSELGARLGPPRPHVAVRRPDALLAMPC